MLQGRVLNRPKRGGRVEADGRLLDGARGSEPEQAQGLIIGPAGQPPRAEAGAGNGAITNADTGSFQITSPNSTETSDSGSYDTRTIDKDITAVMAVTFRVE
ncbi:MAG: hypothetical protein RLZZ374_2007 [Cyanobacteriota bacterium]